MGIIAWIILGFISGLIAKAIMPGRDGGGFVMTTLLGIIGAVVGGFLANSVFGAAGAYGVNLYSILVSVVGAIVVLFVYHLVTRRSTV
jgi:uncharacterized membrane protein YeaQ/YmgE (transglycosylase-associated protein family)